MSIFKETPLFNPATTVPTRRTNSLGRAKSDCHTCSKKGRACDRQRPRCNTCERHNVLCGGYVLPLFWQSNISPRNRDSRSNSPVTEDIKIQYEPETQMAQTKGENTSKASAPQIREFRFKAGRPKRRRKPSLNGQDKPRKDVSNPGCSDTTPARGEPQIFAGLEDHRFVEEDYDTLASNILYPQQVKESLLSGSEHSLSDLPCRKLVASEESWPCESVDEAEASEPNSSGSSTTISSSWNDAYVVPSRAQPDPAWSLVDGSASSRERCSPMSFISSTTTVSPGILHADLPAKFSEVFARYDQEFCVLPLTMDCDRNPFRCQSESFCNSEYLFHAMIAISSHHFWRERGDKSLFTKIQLHKSKAVQLFRQSLTSSVLQCSYLIDTLLIFITLDQACGAFGPWQVHLKGALKLIEVMGGAELLSNTPKLIAQVAMLTWWDTSIALVSRCEPVFPWIYLETVVRHCQSGNWTIFELNGCPSELLECMYELSMLASYIGKARVTDKPAFNMSRVEQLEQAIKDYQNVFDVFNTGDSEAALNARRDRFHCAEAWRQALLIYILRVFKPRSGSTQKISLISRVVLDHVRSIRQIDLVQKQVLLPVFLAGSEISDDYGRQSAQNYCDFWTEKNRYFLFSQARLLLEEVWKERKDSEIDDFWWGVVVDRHEQESPEQISYQYLLG